MASSSHLGPGEKGKITAKIDTSHRKGIIYKTISVSSNDPKKQKVTLTLKADIKEAAVSLSSPSQ